MGFAPKNIVIVPGINELNSSFCAMLSHCFSIGKIPLTSPFVINVPTRVPLAVETKGLLFLWLANLNNKSNVCKHISSL